MKNTSRELSYKRRQLKPKHIIRIVLLLLLLLIILDVIPSFFYRPNSNNNPLSPYYKKGVYHLHSTFSDGKGTLDEITLAAASLNLDFVILTDHGRPNIQSATSTSWKNQVLLIGGTELSLNCGHLAAMGFKLPDYIYPPEPQEAINEIINDNENGVCFVSHPYDDKVPWTDWDISGFTGLEILSSYSEARRAGLLKILIFPLKYLINSKYALLNTMSYPYLNIKKWNSINETGQYYGIYALDAHAKLPITKKIQLNFPTYKSMFEIMTVYVKTPLSIGTEAQNAANSIISSLKQGSFFNVIEAIAPANGFDAYFIENTSGNHTDIGGYCQYSEGILRIQLPFDFKTHVIILKDGVPFYKTSETFNKKSVEVEIKAPGVYRIEVYIPENRFDQLPWIITNPFFLGVNSTSPSKSLETPEQSTSKPNDRLNPAEIIQLKDFKIEKNSQSRGTLEEIVTEENDKTLHFKFMVQKESTNDKNFWSVMALRKSFNFSGKNGIKFKVRSNKRIRAWLEIRSGEGNKETWLRHSFLAKPEWTDIIIPFNQFHKFNGKTNMFSLANLTSIFISINNAITYPGTEGELFLKQFSIY